jgi:peptidoglycan/LPS O-acetylase OafA/YrhL
VIHPFRITLGYALVACGCVALLERFLRFPADLVPRWIIYLGRISYGLYVFHGLANHIYPRLMGSRLNHVLFGNMLITLPVTIACAALSYSFIERPFLQLKQRFELIATRPA